MRTKILFGLLAAILITGCSRTNTPPNVDKTPGNSVRILEVSPASPAKLRVNEIMRFKIAYSHTNANPVLITTEPYAKGKPVTDYGAAGSPTYPAGKGEDWSYFTILNGPSEVDEVRVLMTDFKTQVLLTQTNMPLQAVWE